MARDVEESLVRLKLDNSDLKSKSNESIGLFARLTERMKSVGGTRMDGPARDINNLSDASKRVNMNPITSGIESVKTGFSTLNTVALGAMMAIGSKAVEVGAQIIQHMAAPPVEGWAQYEAKMGYTLSLQSALGKEAKGEINEALGDLEKYALTTRYSVNDMNQNLASFVNAGVGLQDSAVALKGWGNLAAVAGASTEGFANSLNYGVAQALAMGKMTTQNWMSVENANMATQKFKDTLTKNAQEMGKNVDMSNGFRESLQQGWLTNDVFIKSMQDMANDESLVKMASEFHSLGEAQDAIAEGMSSQWSKFFETLIGDVDAATPMWTKYGNAIDDALSSTPAHLTELAKGFVELGGRDQLLATINNTFGAMAQIVGIVKNAFREVFPPATAQTIFDLSVRIREFTEGLKLNEDQANKLNTTFKGIFTVFKGAAAIIGAVASALVSLIPPSLGDTILNIGNAFGTFIQHVSDMLERIGLISKVTGEGNKALGEFRNVIDDLVQRGGQAIVDFFNQLTGFIDRIGTGSKDTKEEATGVGKVLEVLGGIVKTVFGAIGDVVEVIRKNISNLSGLLGEMGKAFSKVWQAIKPILEAISKGFKDVVDTIFGGTSFDDVLSTGLLGGILYAATQIVKIPDKLKDLFTSGDEIGKWGELFKDAMSSVTDSLETLQTSIKVATLVAIAGAVLGLAVALKIIASINGADLAKSLTSVGVGLAEMTGAMILVSKATDGVSTAKMIGVGTAFMAVASAAVLISGALKLLSTVKPAEMAVALVGLAGAMGIMIAALNSLTKLGPGATTGAVALTVLAGALVVMAGALKILASIKATSMIKALGSMAILLGEVALFLKLVSNNPLSVSSAIAIGITANALVVMSGAVAILGNLSVNQLIKGLGAVAVLLGEIVVFTRLMGNAGSFAAAAVSMTIMAGALNLLIVPVELLGRMPLGALAQGLIGLGVALGIMVGGMMALGTVGPQVIIAAASLAVVAGAMNLLIVPIAALGALPLGTLVQGLAGLAGALVILVAALAVTAKVGPGVAIAAASLSLLAVAMNALVPFIVTLGSLPLSSIVQGVGALAAAMAILVAPLVILAPMAPAVLATSIAISALAVSLALLFAAIGGFAAGLAVLLTALADISGSIKEIITNLVDAILENIGKVLTQVPIFIGQLVPIIASLEPLLRAAIDLIVNVFMYLLDKIVEKTPEIAGKVADLIIGIINTLNEKLPELVEAAVIFIITFINTLADNIREHGPEFLNAIGNLIMSIPDAISQALFGIDFGSLLGVMWDGLVGTITSWYEDMKRSGQELIDNVVQGVQDTISSIVDPITQMGQDAINGIQEFFTDMYNQGKELIENVIQGIQDGIGDIESIGENIVNGLSNGISNMWDNITTKAWNLGSDIISSLANAMEIKSPSRKAIKLIGFLAQGLIKGFDDNGDAVLNSADELGQGIIDQFDTNPDLSPVITPVLDMSRVDVRQLDRFANVQMAGSFGTDQAPQITFGDINVSFDIRDQQAGMMTADQIKSMMEQTIRNQVSKIYPGRR